MYSTSVTMFIGLTTVAVIVFWMFLIAEAL